MRSGLRASATGPARGPAPCADRREDYIGGTVKPSFTGSCPSK